MILSCLKQLCSPFVVNGIAEILSSVYTNGLFCHTRHTRVRAENTVLAPPNGLLTCVTRVPSSNSASVNAPLEPSVWHVLDFVNSDYPVLGGVCLFHDIQLEVFVSDFSVADSVITGGFA